MRGAISVDDGSDGCLACVGLELPKDKMLRLSHGRVVKDSKGEKFDKTQYVFRDVGKTQASKAKAMARMSLKTTTNDDGLIQAPDVDKNLMDLCRQARDSITDEQKKPATEVTMANLKVLRGDLTSMNSG